MQKKEIILFTEETKPIMTFAFAKGNTKLLDITNRMYYWF